MADTLLEAGAAGSTRRATTARSRWCARYDNDDEEARHVAAWLPRATGPGSPWRSMAVLARTNAQLEPVAAALEAAGVPVERRGPEHSPASDLEAGPEPWTRRLDDDEADAVALSTIHRAKGLEFEHVAAIGWAEGQLPHYDATHPRNWPRSSGSPTSR